jgi:uncharacterized protein YgbK (DUF1537 family)
MFDAAEGLVQSGVRRLVVAGGETSGAVVDRLAIPGFLAGAEIAAGVAFLRSAGAYKSEMLPALKSSNFGGREFFSDTLKLMRRSFYLLHLPATSAANRNFTERQINAT